MTTATRRVFLLGEEESSGRELLSTLSADGVSVEYGTLERLLADPRSWELVVLRISAHGPQRLEWLRRVRRQCGNMPVIVVAERGSEELAVASFRAGASDYFRAPVPVEQLLTSIRSRLDLVGTQIGAELIGVSRAMRDIRSSIYAIASYPSTCLITGETGTGKELVAGMVHLLSERRDQPFVSINCAAIPDSLLESELFGYERGAFTGADQAHRGKLQEAQEGVIFFDEIGDMSPYAQAKVLRAIETREVYRLGGASRVPVRCRFLAATNQDLEESVRAGRFRKDLYFRLNVMRVELPSLRERVDDIPLLCDHFIRQFNTDFHLSIEGVSDSLMRRMQQYDWPGNVRELRNLIETTIVNVRGRMLEIEDVPKRFAFGQSSDAPSSERDRLVSALEATNWNKSKAAARLRYSRMTLYRKLARYHIEVGGAASEAAPLTRAAGQFIP